MVQMDTSVSSHLAQPLHCLPHSTMYSLGVDQVQQVWG